MGDDTRGFKGLLKMIRTDDDDGCQADSKHNCKKTSETRKKEKMDL